ncbi:MAG: ABC transporter ATP-binding protein [Acidimicrobiales bacterium]
MDEDALRMNEGEMQANIAVGRKGSLSGAGADKGENTADDDNGGSTKGTGKGAGDKGVSKSEALLDVDDIYVSYGPYRVLFGVSFQIGQGGAVALLGNNGAGKSTVVRAISGLLNISSGSVTCDGTDITGWPAWKIARHGLLHVAEGRSVFATLSVRENLELAALGAPRGPSSGTANQPVLTETGDTARHGGIHGLDASVLTRGFSGSYADIAERAYELFPRLKERHNQIAGTLSGGEQRMLSLAKVVVAPHKLVMVDELSLGLSPAMVDEVFESLARLRQSGIALLIVEQHPQRVADLVDNVVVLSGGRVTASGTAGDINAISRSLLAVSP